jgi:hypothetical protein
MGSKGKKSSAKQASKAAPVAPDGGAKTSSSSEVMFTPVGKMINDLMEEKRTWSNQVKANGGIDLKDGGAVDNKLGAVSSASPPDDINVSDHDPSLVNGHTSQEQQYPQPTVLTSNPQAQPGFLSPPTAPASSAHGLGLGPTLVVLDDPSNKYLQAQQSFYATHPLSHTSVTSSIPDVPPPLPVSLPRLPCIPPLVVHQEQLYFDDGLGAPGRCPHERKWGEIGNEHKESRGLGLSDVEMDDFMVDLGDLVSKEYDAWIERCW